MAHQRRTVAVTGQGIVCAAGATLATLRATLAGAVAGCRPLGREFFPEGCVAPCFVVDDAELTTFPWPASLPAPDPRAGSRSERLLLHALGQALCEAQVSPAVLAGRRVGVAIGTTVACNFHDGNYCRRWRHGEEPGPQPFLDYLSAGLAVTVQRALGVHGPRAVIANACTSGTDAIGLGRSWLALRQCDMAIVGGADGLSAMACHGFKSLMLLSDTACAPFDRRRRGLTLGEGAGVLILEGERARLARGVPARGYVRGFAMGGDAYHPTAPHPQGRGLCRAISAALADARLSLSDLAMINAHGTGTLANDLAECSALAALGATAIPVVSTKGATGHALGAAGAIEAILTLDALRQGRLFGTIGCRELDPELPAAVLVEGEGLALSGRIGLSQSLAFAGGNSALVLEGEGT